MASRQSLLNTRVKVYEENDINSPRAKTETTSNYDRLDAEENERLVESRKGTIESARQSEPSQVAGKEEEQKEMQGDAQEYDSWLTWTRPQAEEMLKVEQVEVQKRANYRLGILD